MRQFQAMYRGDRRAARHAPGSRSATASSPTRPHPCRRPSREGRGRACTLPGDLARPSGRGPYRRHRRDGRWAGFRQRSRRHIDRLRRRRPQGTEFSLDEVEENMEVLCCVGPERSWSVLSRLHRQRPGPHGVVDLRVPRQAHRRRDRAAAGGRRRHGTGDRQRLACHPRGVKDGDFNRSTVFKKWANDFDFDRIYVPEGPTGLVANSYHIKVTVDDADASGCRAGTGRIQPAQHPAGRSQQPGQDQGQRATANGTW